MRQIKPSFLPYIICIVILLLGSPVFSATKPPYDEIYELTRQKHYQQAIDLYKDYLQSHPSDANVLPHMAELYEWNQQYDKAIECRERCVVLEIRAVLAGDHLSDQCQRLLTLWEMTRGESPSKDVGRERAHQHYQELLNHAETPVRMKVVAAIILGNIEKQHGNIPTAIDYWSQAYQYSQTMQDDWGRSANRPLLRSFLNEGCLDEASAVYQTHPNLEFLRRLGDQLNRNGRGPEMIDLYQNHLLNGHRHEKPSFSHFSEIRITEDIIDAIIRVQQGKPVAKHIKEAMAAGPDIPEHHRNLGILLLKLNRKEEGCREIDLYLSAQTPPLITQYSWAGQLCERIGYPDPAITYYEHARTLDVSEEEADQRGRSTPMARPVGYWKQEIKAQVLQSLGNLYIKQEQWKKAEHCFNEIRPFDFDQFKQPAEKQLALIWQKTGQVNTIVKDLHKQVLNNPEDEDLAIQYAQALANANQIDEAIAQLQKSIQHQPESIPLRRQLALMFIKDDQSDSAIATYRDALFMACQNPTGSSAITKGFTPSSPEQLLNDLTRYCKNQQKQAALQAIYLDLLHALDTQTISWQPQPYTLERILKDVTEIYAAQGKPTEAIALWLQHHDLGRKARWNIREQLASPRGLNYHVDGLSPLIATWQSDLLKDPNDPWGSFILADLLWANNESSKALALYQQLSNEATASSPILHDLIQVFEQMHQYELALKAHLKSLEVYPENNLEKGRTLRNIARLYLHLDDKNQAVEYYRMAIQCRLSSNERHDCIKALEDLGVDQQGVSASKQYPPRNLQDMRAQASQLLHFESDYPASISLYHKIISKAPTDLESMAYLGKAYKESGQIEEAQKWFEKVVFDQELRKWAHAGGYYGATRELSSIYQQQHDIPNWIRINALSPTRGSFDGIKKRLQSEEELQLFHQTLLEQAQSDPNNLELQFYLVHHFANRNDIDQAVELQEQLYQSLSNPEGRVGNPTHALRLLRGFERLKDYDRVCVIMPLAFYQQSTDRFEAMDELVMRLYAKADHFEQALEIFELRLKKPLLQQTILEIAEQIAEYALESNDRIEQLMDFVEAMEDELPQAQFLCVRTAIRNFCKTHQVKSAPKAHVTKSIAAVDL